MVLREWAGGEPEIERGDRSHGGQSDRAGAGHVLRIGRLPDRLGARGEGAVLDPRRPALPEPRLAAVLRHRRLVADLRPHVPPLRDAVRVRLDRQEHQRLRLHRGGAREPVDPRRRDGVRGALHAARPEGPRVRGQDRQLPGLGPPALRRALPRLVARPPASRARAQFRPARRVRHRGRLDARPRGAARGRDRRPRPRLEDPLDAQLRPVLLDHGAQRDDRGGPRGSRPGPDGTAAVVGRGPQLGLDRGPLEDEGGDQGRRGAARGVRGRGDRARRARRAGGLRARAPVRRGEADAAPAGVRLQGDLVARVRLQDLGRGPGADHRGGPRLPRDRLRLPGQHQVGGRRPRGRQARGHGGRRGRRTARSSSRRSTSRSA